MGAVCSCKRIEDDEISKILNAMLIKNYQVNIIYNNLIAGIKENKIDHTYYTNFICNLINPIDYRDDHVDYFENINISEDELSCVKRIGIIIIFQSSGPYSDKILFLEKHINKYLFLCCNIQKLSFFNLHYMPLKFLVLIFFLLVS